jgi:hypothetical protein
MKSEKLGILKKRLDILRSMENPDDSYGGFPDDLENHIIWKIRDYDGSNSEDLLSRQAPQTPQLRVLTESAACPLCSLRSLGQQLQYCLARYAPR